jgi:hypothetical protein
MNLKECNKILVFGNLMLFLILLPSIHITVLKDFRLILRIIGLEQEKDAIVILVLIHGIISRFLKELVVIKPSLQDVLK